MAVLTDADVCFVMSLSQVARWVGGLKGVLRSNCRCKVTEN